MTFNWFLTCLFIVSAAQAAVVDDFNDGVFSPHWKTDNYPQYSGLGDILTLDEATTPGLLNAGFDNTQGSDQITFVLRDDVTLQAEGDFVQVRLRITGGAATLNAAPGLCLATQAEGINQNRANTIWFALRNDGLARVNAFGIGGLEIAEPALSMPGYQIGQWVTLRIERRAGGIYDFSFVYQQSGRTEMGSADFSGHTVPVVPGLLFANGLADYSAQFEDFTVGNISTEPTPTPTPVPRRISLEVPADLLTLPTVPGTRHQVNFPTGNGDNTYHHNALITHWRNKFHVAWTTTPASECTNPYTGMVAGSTDGQSWSAGVKVGSVTEDAAYTTYMRNRFNHQSGTVDINQAPRGFHATEDRLYLWSLAWMTSSGGRDYVGRIFETSDGVNWSEIPPQSLDNNENNLGMGSLRITASNHGFFRLNDGRLFAFNLAPGMPRYPTTTDPTGLTGWTGGYVLPGACGDIGEPGGYQGPDGVLHGTARCASGKVWHAYSEDGGQNWTSLSEQENFSDSPGNKDWGRLPDGSIYYIGNPETGSRSRLVLGISRDGWTFDENYLVRGEAITPIWYALCKSEDRPGWEYPSAVYHDGCLYAAYSRTRDFIEVSRIDLSGILRSSSKPGHWTVYGRPAAP